MTTLPDAQALLERLEGDMTLPTPELVLESIAERNDARNALQAEINGIDDQIAALDTAKRKLRHTKSLLKSDIDKLDAKKWELIAERKESRLT